MPTAQSDKLVTDIFSRTHPDVSDKSNAQFSLSVFTHIPPFIAISFDFSVAVIPLKLTIALG